MKEFTLLRDHFRIFDRHLDRKFEALMLDHLNITDDEKEQVVRESINEYFNEWRMCRHINYALRHSNVYHRYEYEGDNVYRVEYNPDRYCTSRFDNGENYYGLSDNMLSAEPVDTKLFKDRFIEWCMPWFMQRTSLIMKNIIFEWCYCLDREKDADVIAYDGLIHGSYDELVDTYRYLQSL